MQAGERVGFGHVGQDHGELIRIGFFGVLCGVVVSPERSGRGGCRGTTDILLYEGGWTRERHRPQPGT